MLSIHGWGSARRLNVRMIHVLLAATLTVCSSPGAPSNAARSRSREQPVGIVIKASDASAVDPQGLPVSVYAGDLLFPGDRLEAASGSVTFADCGSLTVEELSGSSAEIGRHDVRSSPARRVRALTVCQLPEVVRAPSPAEQHGTALQLATANPDTFAARAASLPETVRQQLASIDTALRDSPGDLVLLVTRAAVLEKNALLADAVQAYRGLSQRWPDAFWMAYKTSELQRTIELSAAAEAKRLGPPKSIALVIGISKYQHIDPFRWIEFARDDAEAFAGYLTSDHGGALPQAMVVPLLDGQATAAGIRNAIAVHLKQNARRGDTAILYIGAHGTVENVSGYLLANDTHPQNAADSGVAMSELQSMLSGIDRVCFYADVCHAAYAQPGARNPVNETVEQLRIYESQLFGLVSSQPNEYSVEGSEFCGENWPVRCSPGKGHGAFTFKLLEGLSGAADTNHDGEVTGTELARFVSDEVPRLTDERQHPRLFGNDTQTAVATIRTGRAPVSLWRPPSLTGLLRLAAYPERAPASEDESTLALRRILDSGKITPAEIDDLFDLLRRARMRLRIQEYSALENRARVLLENSGQQVILRYLTGDEVPQLRSDYLRGAAFFAAARRLTPDSLFLAGREEFCNGRAMLLDLETAPRQTIRPADYAPAMRFMERSAKIDPAGAYAYNGLGIGYLEQAKYKLAIAAFVDATQRAPAWAYPWHNMALAFMQMGANREAIRCYEEAIRRAPSYSYLKYNLGAAYQRSNQLKLSARAYRAALADLQKQRPADQKKVARVHNALGTVEAAAGRREQARKLYEAARSEDPDSPEALHNLALLLEPLRDGTAVRLWEEAVQRFAYLPSMVALAKAYQRQRQPERAAAQFEAILAREPEYIAAMLGLAEANCSAGRVEEALNRLEQARRRRPDYWVIYRDIGKCEQARKRPDAADAAYEAAFRYAPDAAARKAIRNLRRQ